jgi:hypothetical protein
MSTKLQIPRPVATLSDAEKIHLLNLSELIESVSVLHQQIRKREVLPASIQVDFKNDLDVL